MKRVTRPSWKAFVTVTVVVLATLGGAGIAWALGVWTPLAPLPDPPGSPSPPTEGMAVSGVGEIVVAAYGFSPTSGDTNVTRLYDISTDTWSLGTPAPLPVRSEMAYGDTSHGGNTYAIGGRPTVVVGDDLNRYNVASDTWTSLAPMPTKRAASAVAVVGNALYVMGGRTSTAPCSGGYLSVVERYDIDTDIWTTLAPLPSSRSDFAATSVGGNGGKIYVFGGCNAANAQMPDVDVYDVQTNAWSTAPANMPLARAVHIAGQKGNNVYVFGGRSAPGVVSGINQVYNVVKDAWSTDAPMGVARGETGSYSHGGRIYVPGGALPQNGISSAANEVFKP